MPLKPILPSILRHSLLPLLAGGGLLLPLAGASAAGAPQRTSAERLARGGTLDPRLAHLASLHPAAGVEVIAEFAPGVGPQQAQRDVARVHGQVRAELPLISGLAVRLTAARARALASTPGLVTVALNAPVRAQDSPAPAPVPAGPAPGAASGPFGTELGDTFTATLDAPALWAAGGTGAGVGVAVIDTGIQGDLPDFAGAGGASRVVATAVTNPGATTAEDTYGHGTDVAGIIGGDGSARPAGDPLRGDFRGVAPQSSLIAVKVADDRGSTTVLNVILGLQFAVDYERQLNIRVVNLSLDEDTAQSYLQDPLDAAVEAAWARGLVVVVAAGNRGTAAGAVDYAPANDPYVITVGGADEQGTSDPSDDVAASWSSRGTTEDGFAKPDLYAPGAHIASVLSPGSWFATQCAACIVKGDYFRASGTSFAAPMISGLAADVLELHPEWTPDQVKGALLAGTVATNGLPEVDALAVARQQHPLPADRGLRPNVMLSGPDGSLDLTRSSWSRSSWSSADWTRSSWSRSSWSIAGMSLDRSSWSTAGWSWKSF